MAFDELVNRHRKPLVAYLCRYRVSLEDALDLAQEVFIRAWKAMKNFRGDSSFKTWLYQIAIRTMLDYKRKGNQVVAAPEDLPLPAPGRSPHQESLNGLLRQSIESTLEGLSPRQHHVVHLKLVGEMTFEEMSKVMGSPVGTLKATYFQAIQKLRATLSEEGAASQGGRP